MPRVFMKGPQTSRSSIQQMTAPMLAMGSSLEWLEPSLPAVDATGAPPACRVGFEGGRPLGGVSILDRGCAYGYETENQTGCEESRCQE